VKIAVIGAKGLPAKQGGIEHYCQELYPRLVKQGHSVDLFARSSYTGFPWLHHCKVRGVRVISLPSLSQGGLDAFFNSVLAAIAASGTRYDIVHFHAMGPSLMSWLPSLASSAKVIVNCQGLDGRRAKWGKFSSYMLRLGERVAVRYANGLIVVSEELNSYFMKTYGRETIYIPNGPAGFSESDPSFSYGTSLGLKQQRYILFLGRLVPEKCPDLLIQAFKTLKPQGWKLVLVGGHSHTQAFTSTLNDMTTGSPDVVFTGELQGASLAEIVRGAGLFVLPSELEGLPLAMIEAMQEGIPVLASNIPPHRQLIGESRGLLFQTGDVDSCIRCLDWAIRHPQEMATMASNAQKHVQIHYNWDHIAAETLKLCVKLISTSSTSMVSRFSKPAKISSSIDNFKVKPLGSYLVEANLLTQEQVNHALADQEVTKMRLGEILVRKKWINQQTVDYLMERVILPERAAAKKTSFHQLQVATTNVKKVKHLQAYLQEIIALLHEDLQNEEINCKEVDDQEKIEKILLQQTLEQASLRVNLFLSPQRGANRREQSKGVSSYPKADILGAGYDSHS